MMDITDDLIDQLEQRMRELGLGRRQREVTWHLMAGMDSQEIADALYISVSTVKNHIWQIYDKLDLVSDKRKHRRVCLAMLIIGFDVNQLRERLKETEAERL